MEYILWLQSGTNYLQGAKIILCNDHKPLARFLNWENANNKVNRSRTAQHNITEHLTPQPNADTVTTDITIVKDIPDAPLKPLTEDRLHTLLQIQRTDSFCKCIKNIYQMENYQSMRVTSFSTSKDYYINILQIQTRILDPCHTKSLEVHSASGSTWPTWSLRSYSHILTHKTAILLERHEQGYQEIHS